MIAPISSWAAAVSGMVDEGVYSGIELFVRAIPYNYYSLLTIVFVVGMALMGFDYGPMAKHERNAREKGDLFTEGERVANADNAPKGSTRGKGLRSVDPGDRTDCLLCHRHDLCRRLF